jgi:hypothetical protein
LIKALFKEALEVAMAVAELDENILENSPSFIVSEFYDSLKDAIRPLRITRDKWFEEYPRFVPCDECTVPPHLSLCHPQSRQRR